MENTLPEQLGSVLMTKSMDYPSTIDASQISSIPEGLQQTENSHLSTVVQDQDSINSFEGFEPEQFSELSCALFSNHGSVSSADLEILQENTLTSLLEEEPPVAHTQSEGSFNLPTVTSDDLLTTQQQSLLLDINSKPRDSWITDLLECVSGESDDLSKLRISLFSKVKNLDAFPGGELIRRNQPRTVTGCSLLMKLAEDCYRLCMFINGGHPTELSTVLTKATLKTSQRNSVSTPGRKDNGQNNASFLLSGDMLADMKKDILLLKQSESEHTLQIDNLTKVVDSQKSVINDLKKTCSNLLKSVNPCETVKKHV